MTEVEEAKAAVDGARRVHDENYRAYRASAGELQAARTRHLEAVSRAAPTHPWEGKTVGRVMRKRVGGTYQSVPVRGVVFTYRHGDDVGRGHYALTPGLPMVRLLKADGTPGKITENFCEEWKLGEPTTPQTATPGDV